MDKRQAQVLDAIVIAGIRAAHAGDAVRRAVERRGNVLHVRGMGRDLERDLEYDLDAFHGVTVLGAGKAAPAMARALEDILGDDILGEGLLADAPDRPARGLVVTKHGHGPDKPLRFTRVMEAGHPVPDQAGVDAAHAMLDLARNQGEKDLVFFLLSGGASALTPLPRPPLGLEHKRRVTELLMRGGADIGEINTVRKHLSLFKGGGLARALHPAQVCCLAASDVLGDPLDVIGSGPTVPDAGTFADCLAILERRNLLTELPIEVRSLLEQGRDGQEPETAKPGDQCFAKAETLVIANNVSALEGAAAKARGLGFDVHVLTSRLRGEAREAAKVLAGVAEQAALDARSATKPVCLLAGGETTVTVTGQGKGGRNQEMALALALALEQFPDTRERICAACVGTDGTDGPTDAAGALVLPDTLARARQQGLDPADHLASNDAYSLFKAVHGLVMTGPTNTNVMDLVVLLVEPSEQ